MMVRSENSTTRVGGTCALNTSQAWAGGGLKAVLDKRGIARHQKALDHESNADSV